MSGLLSLPRCTPRQRILGENRFTFEPTLTESVRERAYRSMRRHVLRGGALPDGLLDDRSVATFISQHAAPTPCPVIPECFADLDAFRIKMDSALANSVRRAIALYGTCEGWDYGRLTTLLCGAAPAAEIIDCLYEPLDAMGQEIDAKIAAICPATPSHHKPAIFMYGIQRGAFGFDPASSPDKPAMLAIEVNSPVLYVTPSRKLTMIQTKHLGYAWNRIAASFQMPFMARHEDVLEIVAPYVAEVFTDAKAMASIKDGIVDLPEEAKDLLCEITGGDVDATDSMFDSVKDYILWQHELEAAPVADKATSRTYIEENPTCAVAQTIGALHRLADLIEGEPKAPEEAVIQRPCEIDDEERGPACAMVDLCPRDVSLMYQHEIEHYHGNSGCAIVRAAPEGVDPVATVACLRRTLTEAMVAAAALDLVAQIVPTS